MQVRKCPAQHTPIGGPVLHELRHAGKAIQENLVLRPEQIEHEAIDSRARRRHRSEEHTSELQSPCNLVCRLLLEKKKSGSVNRTHIVSAWSTMPHRHL